MSAFEDNPFAEDDGEPTASQLSTTRKRAREGDDSDAMGTGTSANPSLFAIQQERWEKQKHDHEHFGGPSSTSSHSPATPGSAVHEANTGGGVPVEVVPTATLLAEYDTGLEEDEYNALVVKSAGLESEIRRRDEEYAAELSAKTKDNESMQESVELLRATVLRVRQEMELCRRAKDSADANYYSGSDVINGDDAMVELMQMVEQECNTLQRLASDILQSSAPRIRELMETTDTAEEIRSRIVGVLGELPRLPSFDLQGERRYIEACRAAASKLDSEGPLGSSVLLIQALISELFLQLQNCESVYGSVELLNTRVMAIVSSLQELVHDSLEWYFRTRSRAFSGNSSLSFNANNLLPPEVFSAEVDIRQMNTTLHHLDATLSHLQALPHVVSLSHQNAPSVFAMSVTTLCEELESEAEELGLEVLRLRKLFNPDASTLVSNAGEPQESSCTDEDCMKNGASSEKVKWLNLLSQKLLKQNSSAAALCRTLRDATVDNDSPVVNLQMLFYRCYSEIQGLLLQSLTSLNRVLQQRARIVEHIRQVVMLDGDDEAFALCAERVFQGSEDGVEGLLDEMEESSRACIHQFSEASSKALDELMMRNQQNVQRLLEVRRFFIQVAENTDQLAYGGAAEGLRRVLHDAVEQQRRLTVSEETHQSEEPLEISVESDENGFGDVLDIVASEHKEELREEIQFARRRGEELLKRRKWLAMQPTHKDLLELLAVHKEVKAVKEKLALAAQRQAKWAAAKEALEVKRRQVAEAQAAVLEKQSKLRELQQKLQPTGPFGSW
ncbi:hypothetical protein DPX39_030030700 [Trypanosoma brucei equiperdum]|uniref:Uncharacterized protein n=1 Tax=Trypanosoma brucei equiperdum TaxID=630700 RepID=A0A3L6LBD1_9TRYP|nr:hypothetical protein DPX39_030030700 [Trypanosoma brucei equiperdum]